MINLGDARSLPLSENSIECVVTSPPYNVGTDYTVHDDNMPWEDYIWLVEQACYDIARVLVPGGRAWINIAAQTMDGSHRRDLTGAWSWGLNEAGLKFRDTIVWLQDAWDGGSAWGSWRSPSAPNLRGMYENILCFYKGMWKRPQPGYKDWNDDFGGKWEDIVRNVWQIRPQRRNLHPAPFPIEIPYRIIRLSTVPGEHVLDPFVGQGTSVKAAIHLGRKGIGFDIDPKYVEIARESIRDETTKI